MTAETGNELVIDTGPLSHLAEAGWLGVLRSVAADRAVIVPDAVESELRNGLHTKPHLQQVLDCKWIVLRSLSTNQELTAFAHFAEKLVARNRNLGETEVLAYAKVHGAVAVIDDRAARKAALEANVDHLGTLNLLCQGVREGRLTLRGVSDVADHLIETKYRLPFGPGEFENWAIDNGLTSPNE